MRHKHYELTEKNLETVVRHLERFEDDPPNDMMVARLTEHGIRSEYDQNFLDHEMYECWLMDRGMNWETAHEITLVYFDISPFAVYDTGVIRAFPDYFNDRYRRFHGLEPLFEVETLPED